jgi:hypothetical protein
MQETVCHSTSLTCETKEVVISTGQNTGESWGQLPEQPCAAGIAGGYGSTSLATSSKENIKSCRQECHGILEENLGHLDSARPISPFEQLPSFFPTQYTTSTRVSRVKVLAMFEKSCSAVQRVNEYHILVCLCPQHWLSIVLFVSTSRASTYWNPFKLGTSQSTPYNFLPKPLERKLDVVLSELDNTGDHMELSVELSLNKGHEKRTPSITQVSCPLGMQILDFAKDLGCPVYPERQISPLFDCGKNSGNDRIAALVSGLPNGQLCREEKLFAMGLRMEETKWRLALYQCLRNSPHVPNLLGVVTDNASHHVKSILTDTVGRFTPLTKLITSTKTTRQPIALTRRLSWAQQIVTGIRDLHESGFIVGQLELPVLGVNSRILGQE